jgi:hypothetical protein
MHKRATLHRRLADIAVRLIRWFMRRVSPMRVLAHDRGPNDATLEALAAPVASADERTELVLIELWATESQWECWDRFEAATGGTAGAGVVEVGALLLNAARQAPERRRRCRQSRPCWKTARRSGR